MFISRTSINFQQMGRRFEGHPLQTNLSSSLRFTMGAANIRSNFLSRAEYGSLCGRSVRASQNADGLDKKVCAPSNDFPRQLSPRNHGRESVSTVEQSPTARSLPEEVQGSC